MKRLSNTIFLIGGSYVETLEDRVERMDTLLSNVRYQLFFLSCRLTMSKARGRDNQAAQQQRNII